jgi:hypothetical protein
MAIPWNNRGVVSFNGSNFINVWIPPKLAGVEYTIYTVVPEDVGRLDLISYKVYNDERYFWVIAQANIILDPFNGFSAGNILKIPVLNQYLERWKAYGR